MAASRSGVWAGGDAVSGPASVIEAIAAGRKAASSIDKYLGGDGTIIDEPLTEARTIDMQCNITPSGFAGEPRCQMPEIPNDKRSGFEEVELGLEEAVALSEGKRCFQCGVRLQIPQSQQPPAVNKTREMHQLASKGG